MSRILLLLFLSSLLVAACGGVSPAITQEPAPTPKSTPTAPEIPLEVQAEIAKWSAVNHYWSYSGSGEPGQGPIGEIRVWDLNGNSVQVDIDWASTQINIHAVDDGSKIDYSVHEQDKGLVAPFDGVLVYFDYDQYHIYYQFFWDPTRWGPQDNPHPFEG